MNIGEKVPELAADAYVAGQFKRVSLRSYKGKWVVLFFYPLDFTFVCPTEIKGFASKHKEFEKLNAVVLAASTDSQYSHKAWFERDLPDVKFPIIADTARTWATAFGVLKQDQGIAYRATFIIDPEGTVRSIAVSDLSVGRSVDEVMRMLQAFQTGELCPIEWRPGQKTLGK